MNPQNKTQDKKKRPISAYVNGNVSNINYKNFTDLELETERNRQAILGIIEYIEDNNL